ncbi:SRPBCC family protein [Streptodolium elevatio]
MRFETRIDVAATPEEVWAQLADVAAWPEFIPTMSTVTLLEDGPIGVGSTARIKQPGMPAFVWRVTEWTPGTSFTWQTVSPGVTTVATHSIHPEDGDGDGTSVVLGVVQTGWLAPLIALTTGSRTRRYVTTEAASLKERCEKGRPGTA